VSIGPVKESSLSLPRRVANTLRDAIQSGQIATGERLPMETQLADQLGVSRATLRDGLRILEAEGLVVRRSGVGTFATIAADAIRPGIERLYGVTELIRRAGYTRAVATCGYGPSRPRTTSPSRSRSTQAHR